MENGTPFVPFVSKLFEYDPLTATHALETMDEAEAVAVITTLPPAILANIFKHLRVDYAAALLKEVPSKRFRSF